MDEINLTTSCTLYKNKLHLGVENLGELQKLLDDVKEKENALHESVHRLQQFSLEISFSNE